MKIVTSGITSLIVLCLWSSVTLASGQITQHFSPQGTPSIRLLPLIGGGSHRNNGFNPTVTEADQKAQELITQGEALLKSGDTKDAISTFQEALNYAPTDSLAYQRLAEANVDAGRLNEANQTFHRLLIDGFGPGFGNNIGNSTIWAEYALVLIKVDQATEAVAAYQHAAFLLNFQGGNANNRRPYLRVLLPELVAVRILPNQERYTPERLQALAETAIAHEEMAFGSNKEALAHLREAIRLYPDSPVTNYYLGEALLRTNDPGAKAAYQKAAQLGDDQTIAAAKERIGMCR